MLESLFIYSQRFPQGVLVLWVDSKNKHAVHYVYTVHGLIVVAWCQQEVLADRAMWCAMPKKSLRFLVSARVGIFKFLWGFFRYESMSNCSQNCWIDWESARHAVF